MVNKACKECGVIIVDGSKFCKACGSAIPVEQTCVHCGAKLPENANFCPVCGRASDEPAEIPKEALIAENIRARYRRKSVTGLIILAVLWITLLVTSIVLFINEYGDLEYFLESDEGGSVIAVLCLFSLLYSIIFFSIIRMKRRQSLSKAGMDFESYKIQLLQYKTLTKEKKQWEALNARRKKFDDQLTVTGRTENRSKWASGVLILACIAIVFGLTYIVSGDSLNIFGNRTLNGVWVDAKGASYSGGMRSNPAIMLFKPNGRVYAYQQGYANSESDIINDAGGFRGGSYGEYSISGDTITVKDHKTGKVAKWEIKGDTIWVGSMKFVPGHY